MSLTRKLCYLAFALLFIFSLLPFAGIHLTNHVRAATYNLVKYTNNPVVSSGMAASNATVIYDSSDGLYKMWYVQTSSDDTIRSYIFSLLNSNPTLLNDLKAGNFNAVAASDSGAIKSILTSLAGLSTIDLTNYLNSVSTSLKYATSTNGITWSAPTTVTFTTSTTWDQFITSPNAIKDGNTFKMWYAGNTVSAADLHNLFVALDAASLNPANISTLLSDIITGNIASLRSHIVSLSLQSTVLDILSKSLTFLGNSKPAIGYAESTGGINWIKNASNPVMVTSGWDNLGVMTPSVIKNSSNYDMWYTGINIGPNIVNDLLGATSISGIETALLSDVNIAICHATSTDGISGWTKDTNPVLQKGISTEWDSHCVFAPSVIKNTDGSYDMWYTGGKSSLNAFFNFLNHTITLDNFVLTGINTAIGHATSTNGTNWTKDTASNPVISKGGSGTWDNYGVAFPSVVSNASYIHLWYTGATASPTTALTSFLNGSNLNAILAAGTGTNIKIGYATAPISTTPTTTPGGGGGPGGPAPPGVTNVYDKVGLSGIFAEDVTACSADQMCCVIIPKSTIGLTSAGGALFYISIFPMESLPPLPADFKGVGLSYNVGPLGTTFNPAITISFSYKGLQLPSGTSENNITVGWIDAAGNWYPVESTVDTSAKTVTAKITKFTGFGLMISLVTSTTTPTTPPTTTPTIISTTTQPQKPAAFITSNLSITPVRMKPGDTATVSVIVTNTGDRQGTYKVILNVNSIAEDSRDVTLVGGESKSVTFNITKSQPGTYAISIDTLSASLVVQTQVTPTTTPPEEKPKPTSWPIIVGGIIGGMLGLFLAFLVMQYLIRPPTFKISGLAVMPPVVKPGDTATVIVKISNTGNRQGTYKAILMVNNIAEGSRDLTLPRGGSETVNFSVVKKNPGIYVISVDNVSGRLVVQEPPGTTSSQTGKIRPRNWPGLFR